MKFCLLLVALTVSFVDGNHYYVTLQQNGPAILGANITIVAQIYDASGIKAEGEFYFYWNDNAPVQHVYNTGGEKSTSIWNISYPAEYYKPAVYRISVEVKRATVFDIKYWVAGDSININVTSFLNGEIQIVQNKTLIGGKYIANDIETEHNIVLLDHDLNFILQRNGTIVSHWFIDCMYMGMTLGFSFPYNYTTYVDRNANIGVYLIVHYDENENETNALNPNDMKGNDVLPEICNSLIPVDPNKTYGFFSRDMAVRSPIQNVTVSGSNWYKQGQLLNLTVTCDGSPNYWHCVKTVDGDYNATGKESCTRSNSTNLCHIYFAHYFGEPQVYTLLFIIGNDISKVVTPFSLTIFTEPKHAQLSVIIVPVSCSAVAVILIVFGVAYYIQKRSRYLVEVADFDFSQTNDTEYKTFRERLRDAVSGAFTQATSEDVVSEEGPHTSRSPSKRYGSMQ